MTEEQMIANAAAILMREMAWLGEVINEQDALKIARRLFELWKRRA
jgi:hypothetical protein